MPAQYHRAFIVLFFVYQITALALIIAGIGLLISGAIGVSWIVPGTLLSFLAAFADAWVLLIEINRLSEVTGHSDAAVV